MFDFQGKGSKFKEKMENKNYVYMIQCQDESFYTGITKDLKKRMRSHFRKEKQGAKYTKSRQAVFLKAVWETESWSFAGKWEHFIKTLSRKEKEKLVENPFGLEEIYWKKKKTEPPVVAVCQEFGKFPISLEEWILK